MSTDVQMPALSPTMTEGKIARWLNAEGDHVAPGDAIAEIETDKATMEVEAVYEGILAKIVIPEGTEHVAVNTPIVILAAEGESAEDAAKSVPAAPVPKAEPQPKAEEAPTAKPSEEKKAAPPAPAAPPRRAALLHR